MTKIYTWTYVVVALTILTVSGCSGKPAEPPKADNKAVGTNKGNSPADEEAALRANLDKLSPEDRKLAEAQGYCAVESKNRLGSMGVPVKITINDQPVFLCCDGCETRARAHADRTLARVQQLKEKQAATPAR